MKTFIPKINRTTFKERVLQKQENEGNNGTVVKHINIALDASQEVSFFDNFIKVCNSHHITIKSYYENEVYNVTLYKNEYDSYSLKYDDKNKDITMELANTLYKMLWEQVYLQLYVNNIDNI